MAAPTLSEDQAEVVAQLIDDLRNNGIKVRLNGFKQLMTIADGLGPQRTREELLPYLAEFIDDEEDGVLVVLAEELGPTRLQTKVGGVNYLHTLLPLLEKLSGCEETVVRTKATTSIKYIAQTAPADGMHHVLDVLGRLASGEWITSREASCMLLSTTYQRLGSKQHKQQLLQLFSTLCQDETPMVRKGAALAFGEFVNVVGFEDVDEEMFPAFSKLARDGQDVVRLTLVKSAVPLVALFTSQDKVGKVKPIILALAADRSWRVRYQVAITYVELTEAMGAVSDSVVDAFVKLLQDPEAEVRTAAATKVAVVAKLFGAVKTTEKILGLIPLLVVDTSEHTRAALASVLLKLTAVIRKKEVFDLLLPNFLLLLKDQSADVRLNLISKLDSDSTAIGVELLSQSLHPAIVELSMDHKWRVRLSIIQHVPHLAKQLGPEFFEAKLADVCMNWLGDSVWSIRNAATANLNALVQVFGVPWAKIHIIPKVADLGFHKSYLYRMTSLFAIKGMAQTCGAQVTTSLLLPVVLRLATDAVPNVRFNAARTLGLIMAHVTDEARGTQVKPLLDRLLHDSDPDVRYYAFMSAKTLPGH